MMLNVPQGHVLPKVCLVISQWHYWGMVKVLGDGAEVKVSSVGACLWIIRDSIHSVFFPQGVNHEIFLLCFPYYSALVTKHVIMFPEMSFPLSDENLGLTVLSLSSLVSAPVHLLLMTLTSFFKISVIVLNCHNLRNRKKSMCFWDRIFSLKYTLYCAYFCMHFINIFNIHFSLCASLIKLNKYIKRYLLQNSDEDKSLPVYPQMVEWYPWQKFVG